MIVNDSNIKNKIKSNSKDKYKIKRAFLAFVFGGLIGLLGQIIYIILNIFVEFFLLYPSQNLYNLI